MDFKQMLSDDLSVFVNLDEFAETRTIEGRQTEIVLDDDKLLERQGGAELGIAESGLLFFAKTSDLPPRRNVGALLNIDGRDYTIDSWTDNAGISQIAVSEPRTI